MLINYMKQFSKKNTKRKINQQPKTRKKPLTLNPIFIQKKKSFQQLYPPREVMPQVSIVGLVMDFKSPITLIDVTHHPLVPTLRCREPNLDSVPYTPRDVLRVSIVGVTVVRTVVPLGDV